MKDAKDAKDKRIDENSAAFISIGKHSLRLIQTREVNWKTGVITHYFKNPGIFRVSGGERFLNRAKWVSGNKIPHHTLHFPTFHLIFLSRIGKILSNFAYLPDSQAFFLIAQ